MESRMNDIYGVRNNVLTECEKMLQYVNIIKNKTDDVVDYIKHLNTQNFLKQYTPVYKYLHELNEKLVEQNCQFELFFFELRKFPPVVNDTTTVLSNIDTLPETDIKTEACTLKDSDPILKNNDNVFDKSSVEQEESVNLKTGNECNVNESTQLHEEETDLLNIENIIEKWNKRCIEREEETASYMPDLRPVVIANDYYESTSTSERSTSTKSSPKKIAKKKSYTHTRERQNIPENKKTNVDVVKNIEIKPSLLPREGDLCYVSHVVSPSEFYIQIISEDNSFIDYLSHQIKDLLPCLKSFPTKIEAKKSIVDYCVCFIAKTDSWYRAKILSWLMENEELISVQLIDYGNTCFVPLKNVRETLPYLFALQPMATKCKLAWVKPPNNSNEWPNKSMEYFRNMLCSNDESLYFLSYVQQDKDYLCVDLQNNNIVSLAGDLIANKVAIDSHKTEDDDEDDIWCNDFMKDQIIHSQGFNKNELEMTEEAKMQNDFEFDDDEEHTDPTAAVAHYTPRDESNICRIFLANGYCFKGDNCRFSHTPLNSEGWTTDRDAVYFDAFNKLILPKNGEITVKIISIVDLRTYYAVIKNLPHSMISLTQPVSDIKSLVKYMNDPAEVNKYKPLKVKPANGELILVQYNHEKWQRGKILECYEYCNRVELDVFLVDFGVILERINMKKVRAICDNHLHLPFQAIMCCLANAKMKQNITEVENDIGSDYLEMNILNKKLKAKIVYSSSYLNVNLFNEEGNDIGEELIRAEILERCPHVIELNENNHILID